MRALGAASQTKLSKYADNIRELSDTYTELPGGGWWLVALADIRMRSGRMERIRRRLEAQHTNDMEAGRPSSFDPSKPWDQVFLAASMDKEFWDREVKEKATLYVMNLKSRSELVDPGHGAKFPEANAGSLEEPQPPHKRARRGQPQSKRMQSNGDGVSSASASARGRSWNYSTTQDKSKVLEVERKGGWVPGTLS